MRRMAGALRMGWGWRCMTHAFAWVGSHQTNASFVSTEQASPPKRRGPGSVSSSKLCHHLTAHTQGGGTLRAPLVCANPIQCNRMSQVQQACKDRQGSMLGRLVQGKGRYGCLSKRVKLSSCLCWGQCLLHPSCRYLFSSSAKHRGTAPSNMMHGAGNWAYRCLLGSASAKNTTDRTHQVGVWKRRSRAGRRGVKGGS